MFHKPIEDSNPNRPIRPGEYHKPLTNSNAIGQTKPKPKVAGRSGAAKPVDDVTIGLVPSQPRQRPVVASGAHKPLEDAVLPKPNENGTVSGRRSLPIMVSKSRIDGGLEGVVDWFRRNNLPSHSWLYLKKSTEHAFSKMTGIPMVPKATSSKDEKREFLERTVAWLCRHNHKSVDNRTTQLIVEFHRKMTKGDPAPDVRDPVVKPSGTREVAAPTPALLLVNHSPPAQSACCVIL